MLTAKTETGRAPLAGFFRSALRSRIKHECVTDHVMRMPFLFSTQLEAVFACPGRRELYIGTNGSRWAEGSKG
jgi:hypothetical protein